MREAGYVRDGQGGRAGSSHGGAAEKVREGVLRDNDTTMGKRKAIWVEEGAGDEGAEGDDWAKESEGVYGHSLKTGKETNCTKTKFIHRFIFRNKTKVNCVRHWRARFAQVHVVCVAQTSRPPCPAPPSNTV